VVALVLSALAGARVFGPAPVLAATGVLGIESPLHEGPDPGTTVVALLPAGTQVAIDGAPIDGFYPVSANGEYGWMRGEVLLVTKDVPLDSLAEPVPVEIANPSATDLPVEADAYLQEVPTAEPVDTSIPDDPVSEASPVATEISPDSSATPLDTVEQEPVPDAPTDLGTQPPPDQPLTTDAVAAEGNKDAALATPIAVSETPDQPPAEEAAPDPTSSSAPQGPASVTVDAPIHSGPGPGYDLIFTVPQGSTIEQTGNVVDGYVTVRYKEVTGWLALSSLAPPSDFATEAPEAAMEPVETKIPRPGSGVAYTTVDLSLRDGPSATASPVSAVPAGSRVVLTGVMEGGFQRVTYRDQIGWIANNYLQNPPNPDEAPGRETEDFSRREIVRYIYAAADRYGQSREDMLRVAQCESNLNPYAVNPSGSYGLFQFIRSTWKSTPYGDQDVFNPRANANAAGWMWSQGRKSEWVCQ
jgi:uncharacterized protein YraI